ncbi:MAG: flagellar hook-basal body protein [Phycisphaerales bacterium]
MNYGMQISASGVLTSLYRMDVAANNLANVSTVGFKPDFAAIRQRDAERVEARLSDVPANELMERLGGGVFSMPTRTSIAQGVLTATTNALDLAIEGPGFFAVRDGSADGEVRLTRDGRLTRDANGRLVQAASGLPVLDESGGAIVISQGSAITVDTSGTIRQNGQAIARLQLAQVENAGALKKAGHGLFAVPEEALGGRASGRIRQQMVEQSAVDAVRALMAVTDAGRAAESNMSMVQAHDRLADRAINGLGRVSG